MRHNTTEDNFPSETVRWAKAHWLSLFCLLIVKSTGN
nr:MAG TPA: hypothetical protein [Caudoviricetes sp.]